MKLVKAMGVLGLAAFAAANVPVSAAADSGWYGGLGISQSRAKIHDERITAGLLGAGLTVTSIEDDDRDIGFKLLAGRKFNPYFAVEGGYFNLGEFGFTANTAPAGSLTGNIKLQGLNLDAVGMLPFTQRFSALGRVGATYTQAKDTFTGTGAVAVSDPNPEKSEWNYKVGLGVQYDFTRALAVRGEWERYRVNDAVGNQGDIDMLLVGLVYTFGARAATPPPAAVAPVAPSPVAAAPAAAAPAPEPVLVIVPIVAKTREYCSILDIQFEINQYTVQREAEEKIEKVAIFMRKYPETTAVIEGHTDEVGTSADNLRLSQSRAESVVSYLVSRGIARSRLQAVGYGETRPITDNRTDAGRRLNRRINAIIACATDIEGIEPAPVRVTMAMEMEFDANKAEVRRQYHDELRKVANFMRANPRVTATVEGHTSNLQGTVEQAMQLSRRRAENVVNALVFQFGVERSRLSAAGFGETRRFAYNTSIEGRQENRRVNIIFNYPN
ncbi:MAG: OmpA family protein [Burkholderiales bacterium]